MSENELIAEFMEIPKKDISIDQHGNVWAANLHPTGISKHNSQLQYNESWDWLMPVVEKIANLDDEKGFQVHINQAGAIALIKGDHTVDGGWDLIRGSGQSKTPIVAVYLSVVDFIKWYNQQNP